MRTKRVLYQDKACALCSTTFSPRRLDQKYCSPDCAKKIERLARRAYYASNPEYRRARIAKTTQWKRDHPEAVAAHYRKYYGNPKHKESQRLAYLRDYAKNPEKYAERAAAWRRATSETKPWLMLLHTARYRAKKAGIPFDLDETWAKQRWSGKCEATSLEFVRGKEKVGLFSPSIDRIDSTKGYTKDNCWFVLWGVNSWKLDGKWDDFVLICKAIAAKF